MLPRNLSGDNTGESLAGRDLNDSVPTITALARLCADAMFDTDRGAMPVELSDEARTILRAAADTGSLLIRGDRNAVEPGQRFLAVCVERADGPRREFRNAADPAETVSYLEAFRLLCRHGLVMHQMGDEFSLTARGFELARSITDSLGTVSLGTG